MNAPTAVVHRAARSLSAVGDRLRPAPAGVVVLAYHRVGAGTSSMVDIPLADFRRQMEYLHSHCRVMSLDEVTSWMGNESVDSDVDVDERRAVALTFDDGTDDFVERAGPVLVELGLPATVYLATQFIESGEPFPWGAPALSWDRLAAVCATSSIEAGSHTHSHVLLDRAEVAVAEAELDRSIELIRSRLGYTPRHFAYPKAVVPRASIAALVAARFRSAALAGNRVNVVGSNPQQLWRSPLRRTDSFDEFVRIADGGMRFEGALRSAAARIRYRGER